VLGLPVVGNGYARTALLASGAIGIIGLSICAASWVLPFKAAYRRDDLVGVIFTLSSIVVYNYTNARSAGNATPAVTALVAEVRSFPSGGTPDGLAPSCQYGPSSYEMACNVLSDTIYSVTKAF
jgi:hypothetical protein